MVILKLAALIIGWFYVFWLGFVFCAGAYRAWPSLALPIKFLLAPPAIFWAVVDVGTNYTVAVLLFAELPPDGCYTFTKRISWYKNGFPDSRRGKASFAICTYFLNPFQQGGHCKP